MAIAIGCDGNVRWQGPGHVEGAALGDAPLTALAGKQTQSRKVVAPGETNKYFTMGPSGAID